MSMCEKLSNGICLFIIGLLCIPFGSYLTWTNEANLVCTREAYADASNNVVETSVATSAPIGGFVAGCDPTGTSGDFLHLECPVDDSVFTQDVSTGIVANGAYKMVLTTEQYAYDERSSSQKTSSKSDDSETCYCYDLEWTASPATDIKTMQICDECLEDRNIVLPRAPIGASPGTGTGTYTEYASSVSIGNGAFIIQQSQIDNIAFQPQIAAPDSPNVTTAGGFHHADSYLCDSSSTLDGCWYSTEYRVLGQPVTCMYPPCAGDTRLIVEAYGSDNLSVLGRSPGSAPPVVLHPEDFGGSYIPPCSERSVFYVSDGLKSAETLFGELEVALESLTTLVRIISFLVIACGFYCVFSPIQVIVELVPCVGNFLSPMVGCVLSIFAFIAGLSVWILVFSSAWIVYRPILGIPLFLIAGALGAYAVTMQMENKKKAKTEGYNVIV